jgi:rhodanese-related sulfurtransferase
MNTIHPLKLAALIEADKPVEIIDIRPCEEFENGTSKARIRFLWRSFRPRWAARELRNATDAIPPENYRWPGKTPA